jgi:hypothetical protein
MKKTLAALKKIANTAATAAAVVVTLRKVLSTKKILRRLIPLARIAEKLALCGDLCKYVNLLGCATLSEQLVL